MQPGTVLFLRNQLLGSPVPGERQQYFLKLKMELIVVNDLAASESVYSNMWQYAMAETF